ncbi:MAG: FAD-linked oxidase C-terminal domain-containing protein, partial [Fibrobacterota bacterium]
AENRIECIKAVEENIRQQTTDSKDKWYLEKTETASKLSEKYISLIRSEGTVSKNGEDPADLFLVEIDKLYRGYGDLNENFKQIVNEVKKKQIIIATHMHAGDGNVHVNIPVFSNDLLMMGKAQAAADAVMEKAVALGGVVSGEHGIGITKLKYLNDKEIDLLREYRKEVDPSGIMNPGKLDDRASASKVFTPSFNLLELEARILRYSRLEELSLKIAQCVRCGKCKPDCCVFFPEGGMFFHPRNKNLAIGSLIEAMLYDSQRQKKAGYEILRNLEQIADHCTICHKCLKPCPSDIDTGEVSVLERELLSKMNHKRTAPATRFTLFYLGWRGKILNSIIKTGLLRFGVKMQNLAHFLVSPILKNKLLRNFYPLRLLGSSMPVSDKGTLFEEFSGSDSGKALLLKAEKSGGRAVFYFPGCGSERMFSDISRASLLLLHKSGADVVMPPPSLCCGFPFMVNSKTEQYREIMLRNSIILSQIRDMFNYMDFEAVAISCGTCMESLRIMEADRIFGSGLVDISEYAVSHGLKSKKNISCFYHAPCHDSLSGQAREVFENTGTYEFAPVRYCCSEAGTLALSRPDISSEMLRKKSVEINSVIRNNPEAEKNILTNCPSCLQGLGRLKKEGLKPRHIAVDLAEKIFGDNWKKQFRDMIGKSEFIRF